MIYFKKLRWKNLLSTGNVFTEIDLATKATTLIIGANGAGKSTILDALTFGLFGKPFRKINKPQLLNSITQKNLVVEIEFSIGTVEYKVVRGIKPNVFEVYQNDILLNQSADTGDYQEILEKQILKVNQKSFSQVVVLGTATFQPFMQLTAAQRREIIEDLLGLQIFTVMNSLLKDKLLDNKDGLTAINTEQKVIESKIEMTKQHLAEMEINKEKLIEEKKQAIKASEEAISKYEKSQESLTKEIMESRVDQNELDKIKKKIDKLSKLRHQIEAKLNLMKQEIKFLSDNETCPTCTQPINQEFREVKVGTNKAEISIINDGLKKLVEQYNQAAANLNDLLEQNSKVQQLKLDEARIATSMMSHKKLINSYMKEIESIQNTHTETSTGKIEDFENEAKDIEQRYNELVEEKNVLSFTGSLLKDDGIKSKIIKQYIPIINRLINKYLAEFELFCEFELDENFNETIKSRFRDNFTYASFSEGEKQKIDLALLFTWRAVAKLRNSINTNLLIFDEILDSSLDNNSVGYLMTVINEVSKDNNIVIISHKEQMTERFNHVIKFVKYKNFSQIQES